MVALPNRAPGRLGVCLGLAAAVLIALAAPSTAAAAACPTLDTSATGNCGPPFAVPSWGDAGGWTDPSKYATIQLADVNGDGREELIGRNDDGLEIYWFDTTLGQWRPQVDAGGVPQVLDDFASPAPPDESTPCSFRNPWYYTTIQAGDVDGQPGEEILARFCDGMRVHKYSPPAGGNIDGGTWSVISTGGPFSDEDGYGDPSLYPTIHFAQFRSGSRGLLFARQHSQPGGKTLVFYSLNPACTTGSCWEQQTDAIAGFSDQECDQPSCYLDLLTANVSPWVAGQLSDVVGRNGSGLSAFSGDALAGWNMIGGPAGVAGSFSEVNPSSDCPFSNSGASGPGSGDCLGSSPSYYETLRGANIDGLPGDELVARASDGLRVRQLNQGSTDFEQVPTLAAAALAGAGSDVQPGQWGSIRTGDIDGNGNDEVLALDGLALQAWSYNRTDTTWTQLEPSTPLSLAADPWLTHAEYFSTIRTGDVDGDNRDDVIARGPFGIRTWFYNRRGTGGWESYLDGYPAFATSGEQAAFTALTTLAVANRVIPDAATSVRDVWTGFNAPAPSDLTTLQQGLASIANCSGQGTGNPPSYQACTPPAGSSGFTAADWTSVVNQMLSESFAAGQVLAFFAELQRMRESLSIAARGDFFPDLQQDLGLPAGAGSTAQFSGMRLWDLIFGIAGASASMGWGVPADAGPLAVASSVLSALPSSSPTAVSSFSTTYGGLPAKFAQIAEEIDQGLAVQSQQVRQDAGLLGLVADLYSSRTWALDANGLTSAATQGFATWVYEMLMPTLYDRYQITNCDNIDDDDQCSGVPAGTGVIGGGQNFTTIGPLAVSNSTPCVAGAYVGDFSCNYKAPPSDLMNLIWGPLSDDCTYVPGGAQSNFWRYGCSVGVDVKTSIGSNTWGFTSYSGDYWVDPGYGSGAAAAGRARPRRVIALGRPRHGHQPAGRGRAYLRGDTMIPRHARLAGARVSLGRLLFERGGRGELTRARGGRAPRALRLRRIGPGRFSAAAGNRSRVRIGLRRVGRTRVALTVRIAAPSLRTPRVCHALPAGTALDTPPFELESRVRIGDGRTRRVVPLTHPLRCVRDARGNVSRLVGFRRRPHPARGGLAVTLRGPRRVRPGTTARYVARVHNRRPAGGRLRSSLWDVTFNALRARGIRISRLRPGRSRTLTFTRKVPRRARQRFCVDAVATAAGARAARAVACATVRSTRPPSVTG